MKVVERFDVLARLVEGSGIGAEESEVVQSVSGATGLSPTRVESLALLAEELGFLEVKDSTVAASATGVKFANYMAVYRKEARPTGDGRVESSGSPDFEVCMTLPPMWQDAFRSHLGELVQETKVGELLVVDDAAENLVVVTPYLDPAVLQVKLEGVHRPDVSVKVLTSDPKIAKEYPDGNWRRRKLFDVLDRRFGDVEVYHFSRQGMIVHAKLWVSDGSFFLTSANVSGDSATDNVEIGIYSAEAALVGMFNLITRTTLQMEGVTRLQA